MINYRYPIDVNSRPLISLKVQRVSTDLWRDLQFYKHHYLSADIQKSAKCLLFTWGDEPVAFHAIIGRPGGNHPFAIGSHRLVVLPDFQGLGLSSRILDFTGGIVLAQDPKYSFSIKTIHDHIGTHCEKSPLWKASSVNGKRRVFSHGEAEQGYLDRPSYCYSYIGQPITGYESILNNLSLQREINAGQMFFDFK